MPPDAPDDAIIAEIDRLCATFAERAADVDTGGPSCDALRANIRALAEIGFYGAGVAQRYGGLGLPEPGRRDAVERIAAACGATAFSQNQLHAGGGFISGSQREEVKQELLPDICSGRVLCGVAFAHLRRPGPPSVVARSAPDGLLVCGDAPWISVWGQIDAFILGATDATTGEVLFLYVDRRLAASAIRPSEPMRLAVMEASDTVSLRLDDLFVPDHHVLQRRDSQHMTRSDYCGITSHVTLPLGCARGSVGLLRQLGQSSASERLEQEIDTCRAESMYWNGSRADEPDYRANALRVRSSAVNLALRAAEAGIAASGGRAHLTTSPAQRRLREAGFYATMAITPDTKSALMETFTHAC